jgi:hypothetical protein
VQKNEPRTEKKGKKNVPKKRPKKLIVKEQSGFE